MKYETVVAQYLNNSFVSTREVIKDGKHFTAVWNGLSDWLKVFSVHNNEWTLIEEFYEEIEEDGYQPPASLVLALDAGYEIVP
ncbi:MAG: hypothetical protein ACRC80_34805 [Waterburya sp.]